MRVLLAVLLGLCLAAPAAAEPKGLHVALVAFNAAQGADLRPFDWTFEDVVDWPAERQAFRDDPSRDVQRPTPLGDGLRLTIEGEGGVAAPIVRLNERGGPSTILRGVGPVVVNAIDRRVLRRSTHVGQEVLELRPALAHRNPAATVVSVGVIPDVETPRAHLSPDVEFFRRPTATLLTVREVEAGDSLSLQTTAALRPADLHGAKRRRHVPAAVASAHEVAVPLAAWSYGRDDESAVSLADSGVCFETQDSSMIPPCVLSTPGDSLGLHIALVAFNAAQGADLATTLYALGTGRGREANPVFALVTSRPALAGATKMAISGASAWALIRLHRTRPHTAYVLAIAGTLGYSALAAHNARVVRR